MDQFEEINRKNGRIVKVILSIPIFFCVFIVVAFALYVPSFIKVAELGNLQVEILNQVDMTPVEADAYLTKLTGDSKVRDILSTNVRYNSALVKLYTKKGDYDMAIEKCSSLLEENDSVFYRYYLAEAYYEKGAFEDADREFIIVVNTAPEDFWEIDIYDDEAQARVDSIKIKANAQSRIDLVRLRKAIIDASADMELTKEKSSGYVNSFKLKDEFIEPLLGDSEFIVAYLDLCVSVRDFEEIKRIVPQAIAAQNNLSYHYYLGIIKEVDGEHEKALEEMKAALPGEGITNFDGEDFYSIAKTKALAGIFVAEDYYAKGKYTESFDLYKQVSYQSTNIVDSNNKDDFVCAGEFYSLFVWKKEPSHESLTDLDQDGLSDDLEEVLGTDKNVKDTDGDGYEDEKEYFYGHDPLRKSPEDVLSDKDYCDIFRKALPYFAPFYNKTNNQTN